MRKQFRFGKPRILQPEGGLFLSCATCRLERELLPVRITNQKSSRRLPRFYNLSRDGTRVTSPKNYAIFNSLLTPFMLRPGHRVVLPERFYASLQRDIDAGPDGPRGRRGGDSESIWQTFIGSSGEGEIDGD